MVGTFSCPFANFCYLPGDRTDQSPLQRGVLEHIFEAANQVDPKDSATLKGAAGVFFLRRDLGDHSDLKLSDPQVESAGFGQDLSEAAELSRNQVDVRSIRRRRPVKPKYKGEELGLYVHARHDMFKVLRSIHADALDE